MNIVSWNINGLAACMRKGLLKFIANANADIVCLQEVRAQYPLNLPSYHAFWNLATRKGYSGTLLLTRELPLSVANGFGVRRFDIEGRVITAEYRDYYVINVYVPNVNTSSDPKRTDYRIEWDRAFRDHIGRLNKPVIICGDLNAAHRHIDVYPENQQNSLKGERFETLERAGFDKLLAMGLNDAYRYLNPFQTGAYTWWGPKNINRSVNHGSRLDYFLVSDELLCSVENVEHLSGVYGSDHCPISLRFHLRQAPREASLEELGAQWHSINWGEAEKALEEMQARLALAAYRRDWSEVREAQESIVRSFDAKALAVRAVAHGGSAAGIDGVRLKTDAQKMQVVRSMSARGYVPRPFRADKINDKHKQRVIEIPVVRDRAMMILYRYALDPVAEETADKKSFSARKGRSALDAYSYLFSMLSAPDAPEIAVIIDVRAYYEKIIHRALLSRVHMDREILQKFLTAGYIQSGQLFSKDRGISLGSPLSPVLGNIMLDGLQSYLYDRLYPQGGVDYRDGDLLRFADDMIILVRTRARATQALNIVKDFLEERGLAVNEDKTRIVSVKDGFDFLSWHFQKRNGVIKAWPAVGSVQQLAGELDELIAEHRGTQRELIEDLNRKLTGWATYHRVTDCYDTFRHIDALVESLLVKRMKRRYPRWHQDTIREKFWVKDDKFPVFALPDDHSVRVVRLAMLRQAEHKPVSLNYDPYLDADYYQSVKGVRDQRKASGKYKAVWQRQQGKCAYCGCPMVFGQEFEVVEKELGKGRSVKNLLYIHSFCGYDIFNDGLRQRGAGVDTLAILAEADDPRPEWESPYYELTRFFHFCDDAIVTLTFAQIEEIIGLELDYEAYLFKAFWYDDMPGRTSPMWEEERYPYHAVTAPPRDYCICHSWNTQGYEIKSLDRAKKRVVFHQTEKNMSALIIPKALLERKIPSHIAARANKYLAALEKECGFG